LPAAGKREEEIKVELYVDSVQGEGSTLTAMTACKVCVDSDGALIYSAQVSATRPASDYTARITPYHANASLPLEAEQVLWQR
jgi:glycogen phosphorylase